jgi:thiol-disulfide isomerase/thioredoxin
LSATTSTYTKDNRTRFRNCRFLLASLLIGICFAEGVPAAFAQPTLLNRKAPRLALRDLSGRNIHLRSLRGKVVLLNFWATWCAPCLVEMPVFASWQQQFGPQELRVIGISMDDDSTPVRDLAAKLKLNYPVAMGDAGLGERYGGVLGLPLTFLIDRSGVVRARFQGETDLDALKKQLNLILDQP